MVVWQLCCDIDCLLVTVQFGSVQLRQVVESVVQKVWQFGSTLIASIVIK